MCSQIKKVAVIGAGLMGSGVAQVAAMHGFEVVLNDLNDDILQRGLGRIRESLGRMVDAYNKSSGKKGISSNVEAKSLAAVTTSANAKDLLDADVIVEAAIENETAKKNIIASISGLGYRKLFVSNTSSISITRLASAFAVPEKFMGMHFMNPVPVQPGCELIRGLLTSDATCEAVADFARALGKEPIFAEDKAGFGINRMFVPFLLEAVRVVEEGVMDCHNADKTTLCLGHKMGPIATLDYIGLDTALGIAEVLEKDLGSHYKAPDLLCKLVAAGFYGVKNGKGFYLWKNGSNVGVNPVVERFRRK